METPAENEPHAPPGTWVLRGGALDVDSARTNLDKVHRTYGIWGVCVTAQPGATAEAASVEVRSATKYLMRALSDELADQGWLVVPEPGMDWPDALLTFPNGEPDSTEWDRLREHFAQRDRLPNPNYEE